MEPDELRTTVVENYFAEGVESINGENPVIGSIEKALGCVFSSPEIDGHEDGLHSRICSMVLQSSGYLIILKLEGKYLTGSRFGGEVGLEFKYQKGALDEDVAMAMNAIRNSGLEED